MVFSCGGAGGKKESQETERLLLRGVVSIYSPLLWDAPPSGIFRPVPAARLPRTLGRGFDPVTPVKVTPVDGKRQRVRRQQRGGAVVVPLTRLFYVGSNLSSWSSGPFLPRKSLPPHQMCSRPAACQPYAASTASTASLPAIAVPSCCTPYKVSSGWSGRPGCRCSLLLSLSLSLSAVWRVVPSMYIHTLSNHGPCPMIALTSNAPPTPLPRPSTPLQPASQTPDPSSHTPPHQTNPPPVCYWQVLSSLVLS